jgi:predicted lipoprotein with Yx(FWY)xxD motif
MFRPSPRSGAVLVAALVSALAISACGNRAAPALTTEPVAQSEPTGATPQVTKPKPKPTGIKIKTGETSYGRILQDGRGHSIYLFTKEHSKKSRCFGACAKAWPPVYTKGTPNASGGGVKQSRLGTTKHGKRTQATYNGHPLYYYVGEDEPDEVLCQAVYEFGGYWYVINKAGRAITAKG